MMKRPVILSLLAVGLLLAYGGRRAWRAHKDIVSLEANDIPVQEVVKQLRWQTWEDIELGTNAHGRITLRVEDQPLEAVLTVIAEQANTRWSAAYPLYTTKARLQLAKKVATGQVPQPQPGWTNWNARPNMAALAALFRAASTNPPTGDTPAGGPAGGPGGFGGFGGFGGPGGFMGDGNGEIRPVTVSWEKSEPLVAAFSLRRFGTVKVVPEDGTMIPVTLDFKDAPMDAVVARLAKAVNRKWAKFYILDEARGPRPEMPRDMTQRPDFNPDQMRERFQQMAANPDFQQRMEQREVKNLLNSTPDQRAERDRRRGRGGPGGGRGGPGGGGGAPGGGPGR